MVPGDFVDIYGHCIGHRLFIDICVLANEVAQVLCYFALWLLVCSMFCLTAVGII